MRSGSEFTSKLDMILSYLVSAIQAKRGIEIEKCEEKRMRSRGALKYTTRLIPKVVPREREALYPA